MYAETCTREHFITAIENGIRAAGADMPAAEKAMLRHVGATETRFLVGSFWDQLEECGCPLTMAGLTPAGNVIETLTSYQRRFCTAFDWSFDMGTLFEVAGA